MFKKIFPKMFTKTKKNKTPKELTIEQCLETEKKPVQTKSPLQIVEQEIQSEIEYVELKGKELRAYKRLVPVSDREEEAAQIRPFLPACYKTLAEFCGRRTQPLTAAELQEVRKNADKIEEAIFSRRGKYVTDKNLYLELDYFLFRRMYRIEDNRYRLAQRYAEKQKEVLLRHQEVKETLRLIEEGPLTQQNRQKIKNLITNLTQIIMQGDIAAGYIKRTVPKNMEEEEEKHFLQCKQNTVNRIARQKIEDYKEGKLDASYETMRQALNLPMRVIDKEHPEIYREWLTEAFKEYIQYLGEKEYEKTRVEKVERYHAVDMCLRLLSKEETEYTEQDKKQIHALICDMHSELTLHDVKWAYIPKEVPECQKEEEQKRFLEYRKNIFSKWVLKEVKKRELYLPITDMAKILKLPFREEDIKKYGDACDMVADYLFIMHAVQQINKKTEEYKKSYLESIEDAKGQINDLYRKYFKLQGITREQDLEKKMKRVNEEYEKMFLKYREMADEEVEPAPENWRYDPTLVFEELFVLGWSY